MAMTFFQAEACKSVAMAMKKCPNGMFAEIKYDGERVQIHKQGSAFQFFSRSLKAVTPHKASVCVCACACVCVCVCVYFAV